MFPAISFLLQALARALPGVGTIASGSLLIGLRFYVEAVIAAPLLAEAAVAVGSIATGDATDLSWMAVQARRVTELARRAVTRPVGTHAVNIGRA